MSTRTTQMAYPADPVEPRGSTGFPGKPGETWEDYAHRLERRIKEQREHIDHLVGMRKPGEANKWQKKRINNLLMALGRASEAADRRKIQRDNVIAASREREQRAFAIENCLVLWARQAECECSETEQCLRCQAERVLGYPLAVTPDEA